MGYITDTGRLIIIEKILEDTSLSEFSKLVAISAVINGAKPLTESDIRRGQQLEQELIRDFE